MSSRRLPTIDLLRGFCVIAVVIHHLNLRLRFDRSPAGALLPADLNRALFRTGSYSVKIFFVVSGFLITSTILARWGSLADIDVKAFYRLRLARIAPCLLVLLAILSALHLAGVTGFTINPNRTSLPRALAAAFALHVNWLECTVGYLPGSWDILWSLSIEEAFYLVYPLLCRWLKPRFLIAIAAALLIAGPFFRSAGAPNEMWADYGYFANIDCIALGCLVAAVPLNAGRYGWLAGWAGLFSIVFLRSLVFRKPVYDSGLDVTLLAACAALAIPARIPGIRFAWPVQWFGKISYEVYLTHMFVVTWATQYFQLHKLPPDSAPAWMAGSLLMAGALGYAVARWFSEPLNRRLRGGIRAVI